MATDEVRKLKEELSILREALKPFANEYEDLMNGDIIKVRRADFSCFMKAKNALDWKE